MSDGDLDMGLLTVHMPELGIDVQPTVNVIDAQSLELVKTARADERIEVPAGQYIVSSTLPSGERALGVAQVSEGTHEEVALATAATVQAAVEKSPAPAPAPTPTLERLGPGEDDVGQAAPPADRAPVSAPLFMRYLGVKRGGVVTADGRTEVIAVGANQSVELRLRPGGLDGVI